jgi:hypothetical protein
MQPDRQPSSAAENRCRELCQLPSGHEGPCSFSGPTSTTWCEWGCDVEIERLREALRELTKPKYGVATMKVACKALEWRR